MKLLDWASKAKILLIELASILSLLIILSQILWDELKHFFR
jgi:hypothetical protein